MKTKLFFLLSVLAFASISAKKPKMPKNGVDLNVFFSEHEWMQEGFFQYAPDPVFFDEINIDESYHWVIFAGTWCEDTKYLLPQFMKIAVDKGWDLAASPLYLLGEDKKSKGAKKHKITVVPTFILMKKGKEIGRIEEQVPYSLEQEIARITKGLN